MINSIKVKNLKTNEEIQMNDDSVFVIEKIDWDTPTIETQSYRVPFQIGQIRTGVLIRTRKPSIIGYVIADLEEQSYLGKPLEEYFKMQQESIEQSKLLLDKMFSVFQEIRIEANGYFLKGYPTQPVKYSNDYIENNEVLCMFSIELECFEPLFYKGSKTTELATNTDKFKFPLIIPENKGVIFGELIRNQNVILNNIGDCDVGCTIKVSANGGIVKNPKIYNLQNEDYIEFENLTLNDGDYLLIETNKTEENAIKHIAETQQDISVVGNIKDGSKFIQIIQGSGYYGYHVEEQYQNNVELSITYTERFFNIKGM